MSAPALLLPVDALGLSPRIHNGLANQGVRLLRDLVVLRCEDLLRFPWLGRHSVAEIEAALSARGLHLGADIPDDVWDLAA